MLAIREKGQYVEMLRRGYRRVRSIFYLPEVTWRGDLVAQDNRN